MKLVLVGLYILTHICYSDTIRLGVSDLKLNCFILLLGVYSDEAG